MDKANKSAKEKPHYYGHRERLRERFLADNGHSMPDYELLETLLTAAIPRKDVKVLAKNLIAHFGSFAKVFEAKPWELLATKTPQSAMIYLKVIQTIAKRISSKTLKENNDPILSNTDYIIDYAHSILNTFSENEVVIIYLNSVLKMTYKLVLPKIMLNTEYPNMRLITLKAIQHKATSIVVIAKNSNDDFIPNSQHKKIVKDIASILKKIPINYLEHIIITPNTYISLRDLNLLGI